MNPSPSRSATFNERLNAIFEVDWNEVHLKTGAIGFVVLTLIVCARLFVGPRVFVAAVAALFVLLISARARHIWPVVLIAALYGAVVTGFAERVYDSNASALIFVWLVTFASGLTVVAPLLSALASLLNLWAILAINVIPDGGIAVRGALAWIAGCVLAGIVIGIARRRNALDEKRLLDIDITSLNLEKTVRYSVFTFSAIRATAVVGAAALGLILFDKHEWWAALAALVIAGINAEESRLIAWQRAMGTVIGAVIAPLLLIPVSTQSSKAVLFLILIFLTLLFRPASQTYFAIGLTAMLIVAQSLIGEQIYRVGGIRVVQTLVGIGFALLAIRLAQPSMARIAVFQQALAAALKARAG